VFNLKNTIYSGNKILLPNPMLVSHYV
jgi:hypothetical protein